MMFYLGSIAGILPYILAFSFTIVLGGHASLPFFASESKPESKNEIVEKKILSDENFKNVAFDKQIITEDITVYLVPFCTLTNVFGIYLFRLFDFEKLGLSLLRAPPISLF